MSGQQGRGSADLPQIAASKHVQERYKRDKSEDPPHQLPAHTQVRPVGGQVDPHQHNGYGMQETDQNLEKLLHALNLPRAGWAVPGLPSEATAHAAVRVSFGVWLRFASRWPTEVNADVQVEVLGEEVVEFAAFDDPQPVVCGRRRPWFLRRPMRW